MGSGGLPKFECQLWSAYEPCPFGNVNSFCGSNVSGSSMPRVLIIMARVRPMSWMPGIQTLSGTPPPRALRCGKDFDAPEQMPDDLL